MSQKREYVASAEGNDCFTDVFVMLTDTEAETVRRVFETMNDSLPAHNSYDPRMSLVSSDEADQNYVTALRTRTDRVAAGMSAYKPVVAQRTGIWVTDANGVEYQ